MRAQAVLLFALTLAACAGAEVVPAADVDAGLDAGSAVDAEAADSGAVDAALDAGGLDAEVPDAGAPDAAPDAGPALCPAAPPECGVPSDCQPDLRPPSNCEPCQPYNRALCAEGRCDTPAVLGQDDIYRLTINVSPEVTGIESLATFVVSERTAGDRKLTCDDFYQDRVSLAEDCLNVLDTRGFTVLQTGDTFTVSFASFASGERSLFLIYGHRGSTPRGDRLGVSCTTLEIPGPMGGGPYDFSGGLMRPLP